MEWKDCLDEKGTGWERGLEGGRRKESVTERIGKEIEGTRRSIEGNKTGKGKGMPGETGREGESRKKRGKKEIEEKLRVRREEKSDDADESSKKRKTFKYSLGLFY